MWVLPQGQSRTSHQSERKGSGEAPVRRTPWEQPSQNHYALHSSPEGEPTSSRMQVSRACRRLPLLAESFTLFILIYFHDCHILYIFMTAITCTFSWLPYIVHFVHFGICYYLIWPRLKGADKFLLNIFDGEQSMLLGGNEEGYLTGYNRHSQGGVSRHPSSQQGSSRASRKIT